MKKISLFLLLFLLSACAGFRKGEILIEYPKEKTKEKYSLSVSLESKCSLNDFDKPCEDFFPDVIGALHTSGLYKDVRMYPQEADYIVELKYHQIGEGSLIMAVLCGLTYYLIPSWGTDEIYIEATIIDNKNKSNKAKFILNDGITTVQQVLLLPVLPFKPPFKMLNDLKEEVLLALPIKIYNQILEMEKNSEQN